MPAVQLTTRVRSAVLFGGLVFVGSCGGEADPVVPPPPPDVFSGALSATKTADIFVADSTVVTMTVTNQNGVPAGNQPVFFAVTSGTASLSGGPPWTTGANGQVSAVVRSAEAGAVTVSGYLGTSAAGTAQGSVDLAFIPDILSARLSMSETGDLRMSVEPVATVTVTNQNDDPVAGVQLTFQLAAGTGLAELVDPPAVETNAEGQATNAIRARVPGTVSLTAFLVGAIDPIDERTVSFVTGRPAALRFVQAPTLTLPGVAFRKETIVEVVDDEGFRVFDTPTEIALHLEPDPNQNGLLGGQTVATSVDGRASFPILVTSVVQAGMELVATSQGLESGRSARLTSMHRGSFSSSRSGVCMASTSGDAYCWGANQSEQAGVPSSSATRVGAPSLVTGAPAGGFSTVASGRDMSCGLGAVRPTLWCWGLGVRLGSPNAPASSSQPLPGDLGLGYADLVVGDDTSCGHVSAARLVLFCWGDNSAGQMGNGTSTDVVNTVAAGAEGRWTSLSVGTETTCGIKDGGSLYCWGRRSSGLIPDGRLVPEFEPAPVRVGFNRVWDSVSVGEDYACAVERTGQVFCWGVSPATPTGAVVGIAGPAEPVVDVEVGKSVACAFLPDSRVRCWGNAPELGGPDEWTSEGWTLGGVPEAFSNFSMGIDHACLVDADGKAFCMGLNDEGQLGRGNVSDGIFPEFAEVTGGHTFLTKPPVD